jgi:hypothetical protein
MLADRHITLTASGDGNLKLLSAWHVDNADAAQVAYVRIREGGIAGQIVVPLHVQPLSSVGHEYEHPLNCDATGAGMWYVEFVSGASITVSMSGR